MLNNPTICAIELLKYGSWKTCLNPVCGCIKANSSRIYDGIKCWLWNRSLGWTCLVLRFIWLTLMVRSLTFDGGPISRAPLSHSSWDLNLSWGDGLNHGCFLCVSQLKSRAIGALGLAIHGQNQAAITFMEYNKELQHNNDNFKMT